MKKITFMLLATLAMAFTGCSSDDDPIIPPVNNNQENGGETPITWVETRSECTGTMVTRAQDFITEPVTKKLIITTYTYQKQSKVTLEFENFDVNAPAMSAPITIGNIKIEDVQVTTDEKGNEHYSKERFEIKTGGYNITGSLTGEMNISDNPGIRFTLTYRPANMPFDCVTTFTRDGRE